MTITRHPRRHLLIGLGLMAMLAGVRGPMHEWAAPTAAHAAPTSPTYVFTLNKFSISNTMARFTDTDVVFFYVDVGNQTYTYNRSMGSLNNGTYAVGLHTPPLAVPPGTPVTVRYAIRNQGENANLAAEAVTIGNVLQAALGPNGGPCLPSDDACSLPALGGPISNALLLAGFLFANCDGTPVADKFSTVGGQTLNGTTLQNLTVGPGGVYSETRSYSEPGPLYCNSGNAQYTTTWSVTTPWPDFTPISSSVSQAPAAAVFQGKEHLFAVGTDNRLYENVFDGSTWSGWNFLNLITHASPSATVYGGRLFVFAVGTDNHLYDNDFDGTGWNPMGGTMTIGPSATVGCDGRLEVFAVGTNGGVFVDVLNANGWSGLQGIFGGGTTNMAPTAVCFYGHMHLIAVGTNNLVFDSVNNGNGWSDFRPIGGDSVIAAPSAVLFAGHIHLFEVGTDHNVYDNQFDGSSWSGPVWAAGATTITPPYWTGGVTTMAPAATTYGTQVHLFIVRLDGQIGMSAALWT